MEKISGYARVLAKIRVQQEQSKPWFGKPHLKYGQCYAMAGYFFQLGAILSAKYRENLDAFGPAFLGLQGEPGAVRRFFSEAVEDEMHLLGEPRSFTEYVEAEQIKRFNYTGDPAKFFSEYGMKKIPPKTAAEMAWQFAEQGAILGAIHPDIARRMFEHMYRTHSKEDWNRARAAGLDIPAEEDVMSYDDVEEGENAGFMAYCQQCCPSLHSVLAD